MTFSVTVNGSLVSTDPTLLVALISAPNCSGSTGSVDVHYDVHPFWVAADCTYNFAQTDAGNVTGLYVLASTFDPDDIPASCLGASNVNPISLDLALTAGEQYFAVSFDDTFDQLDKTYSLTISGPGAITLGLTAIFSDGFESGNTGTWSSSQGG